jgi:hypothetical protein
VICTQRIAFHLQSSALSSQEASQALHLFRRRLDHPILWLRLRAYGCLKLQIRRLGLAEAEAGFGHPGGGLLISMADGMGGSCDKPGGWPAGSPQAGGLDAQLGWSINQRN